MANEFQRVFYVDELITLITARLNNESLEILESNQILVITSNILAALFQMDTKASFNKLMDIYSNDPHAASDDMFDSVNLFLNQLGAYRHDVSQFTLTENMDLIITFETEQTFDEMKISEYEDAEYMAGEYVYRQPVDVEQLKASLSWSNLTNLNKARG